MMRSPTFEHQNTELNHLERPVVIGASVFLLLTKLETKGGKEKGIGASRGRGEGETRLLETRSSSEEVDERWEGTRESLRPPPPLRPCLCRPTRFQF